VVVTKEALLCVKIEGILSSTKQQRRAIDGREPGTHQMELPIPYSLGSEIQKKNHLWEYRKEIGAILRRLCDYKGIEIVEANACVDHIHMCLRIPPKYSVAQIMGYLKGKSSLMIFEQFANLKYKFGNRHFWCKGYYVSTVGINEETIRRYIREQEDTDRTTDNIKEPDNPFKG